MSKRFVITVPDAVHAELVEWAEQRGQPPASLAGFLVELNIRQAKESGEYVPSKKQKQVAKAS